MKRGEKAEHVNGGVMKADAITQNSGDYQRDRPKHVRVPLGPSAFERADEEAEQEAGHAGIRPIYRPSMSGEIGGARDPACDARIRPPALCMHCATERLRFGAQKWAEIAVDGRVVWLRRVAPCAPERIPARSIFRREDDVVSASPIANLAGYLDLDIEDREIIHMIHANSLA